MAKNFVSYNDATELMTALGQKLDAVNGAYVLRGSVAFANLPSVLTEAMTGYVYNVTDAFTTDARFVEGAGKKYGAGANVAVADLSTYDAVTPVGSEDPSSEGWYELVGGKYVLSEDTTVDAGKTYYEKAVSVKFDVSGAFIDVDAIENKIKAVSNMIAGQFDDATAYDEGDVVVYEGALYRYDTAHAAGTWDSTEVTQTTVDELIANAEPSSLTTAQINALLALLD